MTVIPWTTRNLELVARIILLCGRDNLDTCAMSHIDGYRGLARFMIRDKDRSPCIFRRFDELGVRNLLYLQSELDEIEERLEDLDIAHIQAPLKVKAGLRDWSRMSVDADVDEPSRFQIRERIDLVLKLRYTMREYRMSVILAGHLVN